jgi:hypothetical protein
MARQAGPNFIVGTIDDLVFYKMNGKYYVRKKSSLSKKRVKKDPVFVNTRRNAAAFGEASKKASSFYRTIDWQKKARWMYLEMLKKIIAMKREGKTLDEIDAQMQAMVSMYNSMILYHLQDRIAV